MILPDPICSPDELVKLAVDFCLKTSRSLTLIGTLTSKSPVFAIFAICEPGLIIEPGSAKFSTTVPENGAA